MFVASGGEEWPNFLNSFVLCGRFVYYFVSREFIEIK